MTMYTLESKSIKAGWDAQRMGSTRARFEVRDFWKYAIQAKHYSWCKKVTSILETVRSVKSRISCQRTVLLAPLTPCNSRACVHRAWQISSRYSSCFRIFISWLKYAFSLSCSWAAWLRRPIDNSAAALCFNLPWAKLQKDSLPCQTWSFSDCSWGRQLSEVSRHSGPGVHVTMSMQGSQTPHSHHPSTALPPPAAPAARNSMTPADSSLQKPSLCLVCACSVV